MEQKITIAPTNGMDCDSSIGRRSPNTIYSAVNLRMNNDKVFNTGEYSNFNGIKKAITATGYNIVKIDKVGTYYIIFLYSINDPNTSVIARVNESEIPANESKSTLSLNLSNYYWLGPYHKVISGNFAFHLAGKISTKTYYESTSVQKIYWSISGSATPMRQLNIIYSDLSNKINTYSASDLDIVPPIQLPSVEIKSIINGSIKSGKICYTYSLSNSSGNETAFAPYSNLINVAKGNSSDSSDYKFVGDNIDEHSGRGFSISISGISTKYNGIKIYSIHYTSDTSLPIISLIYDGSINGSIIMADIGNPILNIAPEEFLSLESVLIRGGLMEIKNNRLFTSDYTEDYNFDINNYYEFERLRYWDSRSYRFTYSVSGNWGDCESIVYNSDGSYFGIPGDEYDDSFMVPIDHDCINISNDIKSPAYDTYIYQRDGRTFGASGINVDISQSIISGTSPDDAMEDMVKFYSKKSSTGITSGAYSGFKSYANPYLAMDKKTFKPGEVYRIGLQFRNSRGQLSYIKWVCDYKVIPNGDLFSYSGSTGPITANSPLYMDLYRIRVNVRNVPTESDGTPFQWRVMYVPLSEGDISAFWGLSSSLCYNSFSPGAFYQTSDVLFSRFRAMDINAAVDDSIDSIGGSKYIQNYMDFICPEYFHGIKKNYYSIKHYRYADSRRRIGDYSQATNIEVNKLYRFDSSYSLMYPIVDQFNLSNNRDVTSLISLDGTKKIRSIGRTLQAIKAPRGGKYFIYGYSPRGSSQVIKTNMTNQNIPLMYISCAYVDNHLSRYGGITYEARNSNSYIPLQSSFQTGSTVQTIYGDSYSGVFEYLRHISDNANIPTDNNYPGITKTYYALPGSCEVDLIPTFSTVNLNLCNGETITKNYTKPGAYMMHENPGVYNDPFYDAIKQTVDIYTQNVDFYKYNKTYSLVNKLSSHYEKPLSSSIQTHFGSRIISSKQKFAGEKVESFFKNSGAYIDVDAQYGDIKSLMVFNDRLYFFQQKAIGIVAVNERSQSVDTNGDMIGIGEIELLSRYDYLTINNGVSNRAHVGRSDSGIYIIDSKSKQLLKISSNGIEKISVTKNVNSIARLAFWDNGSILYNKKYNEVLFFFSYDGGVAKNALVYNEEIDAFTAIYTYNYGVIDSKILEYSSSSYTGNDSMAVFSDYNCYTMNDGHYNKVADSIAHASEITYLISIPGNEIVLFNVVDMMIKKINSSGVDVDFIDTIRIYNDECDTGDLIYKDNCVYKFGKYRTSKLRNYLGSSQRILSNHIFIKIRTKSNYNSGFQNYVVKFRDLDVYFTKTSWFK